MAIYSFSKYTDTKTSYLLTHTKTSDSDERTLYKILQKNRSIFDSDDWRVKRYSLPAYFNYVGMNL